MGQADKTQEEWKSVEALCPAVPQFEKYLESVRQTLDRPPLLQRPCNPLGGSGLYAGRVVKPGGGPA